MATRETLPTENPWSEQPVKPESTKTSRPAPAAPAETKIDYDLEGLMNDFPTARELERFVFDETGVVLNLKGRANKLKYEIARDVLNGQTVDEKFIGRDNPYLDKSDLVPVDPIKDPPARDANLPNPRSVQNTFHSRMIPHPDHELRAQNRFVDVTFRKYQDGTITYEVLGPIDERPQGEKIDKFGRVRPEVITWVDPRTGEQLAQRPDGTLTDQGRRLRAIMRSPRFRVNKSSQWDVWVDRDFIQNEDQVLRNPWGTE